MDPAHKEKGLALVFIYSGEFAERVIRNLINDPSFCKPCGLYCDSCKYGAYTHVQNIKAAIELPGPSKFPAFIDNPDEHMPKKIPKTDLCIASGLHKDLLLELPNRLHQAGVKGLIVPIEDFAEVPSGLRKQVEEKCQELGLESAFPKPFCSLEPSDNKPTISRCITELKIGKPLLRDFNCKERKTRGNRSCSCQTKRAMWLNMVRRKKTNRSKTEKQILHDAIAKAHHSYPCTATMGVDPETKEPILHLGGFIIREAVKKALEQNQ